MDEDMNLDLDFSLTEADIDEILGREHTDNDALSESFIDEAVDEFVENNDSIPAKKKGIFSDVFKKDIKRKRIPRVVNDEQTSDQAEDFLLDDLLLGEDPTSLSEFNEIISEIFPDASMDEEQIRMIEEYLREYGIMLEQAQNAENTHFFHKNAPEGSNSELSYTDDSIIEGQSENPEMGQNIESFFSESEETVNFDYFFNEPPTSDEIQISFLPPKDENAEELYVSKPDHIIPNGQDRLSFDDIEMVYPTDEAKMTVIERDMSCFSSITDPSVNNSTLESITETDQLNKKIFDQINAVSLTCNDNSDSISNTSQPPSMQGLTTFYDPDLHKYYVPANGSPAGHDMDAVMNGQRLSASQTVETPKEEGEKREEGIYEKHSDAFKAVDFSEASVDRSFDGEPSKEKDGRDNNETSALAGITDQTDVSRSRQAVSVASFKVNHGYEEYSETIGRLVSKNITNTTTEIESEVSKGAKDFQNSEVVWWVKTILAPVGASSVRGAIQADGRVSIDAASQVEKYIAAGKLSVNDLNVGGSEECEKIRNAYKDLLSEQADLKAELGRTTALLKAEEDAEKAEKLKDDIDILNAKIRNKEDEIDKNERSLTEQIKQDYNDLRLKLTDIEKEKKSVKADIETLSRDIKRIETKLNNGELTFEKKSVLQRKLDSARASLASKEQISETLGASSPIRNKDILKRHKELYEKFTTREALMGCKSLSAAEKSFVASKTFFGNGDRKLYGSSLQKYLKSKGVSYARDHDISRLPAKDLEKFIKGGKRNGLTPMDIAALRALKVRNDHSHWVRRSGGSDGAVKGTSRKSLAFRRVVDGILRSDGVYGESYNRARVKINSAKMTARIAKISSQLIRVSWSTSLINKVNTRIIRNVKVNIKASFISRTIERRKLIHIKARQERRIARRQTYAELMKKLKKPSEFIRQKSKEVRNSFENIKAVKGFNNAKAKAKQGFNGVKRSFVNSKPVKTAKKAGRAVKDKLERSASVASRVMAFLSTPFKVVAKIKSFWDLAKQKILMLLGHIAILFVKFYIAFVLLVLIVNTIINLLGAISGYAEDTAKLMNEMQAKLINYPELRDMKSDVDWILSEDEARREEAVRIGEGRPINPNVTNGRTIDRYGSPERYPGYTLHFLDAYGNEMPSDSTNARDIISLATAMFSNEIGNIHGDRRDLNALDDLIADLYEMLSDRITYEESEIYFCMYGCEYYDYACNEWDHYRQFNEYISNGAHKYENLEPYNSRGCEFDEEGYRSYYEECEDWYYDIKPRVEDYEYFDYGEMEWVFDEDAYEDAINDWGDIEWEPDPDDWYYCHWHYVPICFGHKDIDIYIPLYDIDYAIENRMYPANWESKSYADQIRRFMESGGWDNEEYVEWAHSYYDGDWYGIYGIDVEKGCGFSKGRPLTDEEIESIIERIGSISQARMEIIEFALNAVGKVGYQWGGKAVGSGMGAKFGSSTPDEKGRKNGLDCSGFVQWVYRSAIGVSVPGSTAGYAGYSRISHSSLKIGDIGFYEVPGSEENHMGIYLGVDESGNETWVHCSGSSGATYGTGNFRYYVSVF